MNLEYTAEQIKKIATEAIQSLKNAPLTEQGDYIKIFVNENGELCQGVLSGSTIPFYGCEVLATIKYVHPDYDSDSVMNANGLELTEENFRIWDWTNFTESNDFSNAIENLEYQIEQGIIENNWKI